MMRGRVNSLLEAELIVRVHGPSGTFLDVTAVIDTGFSGFLILPPRTISALGLTQLISTHVVLADGTLSQYENYAAELNGFGQLRLIDVVAVGSEPLIGMKLLGGHELRVEAVAGGAVEIRPLVAPVP